MICTRRAAQYVLTLGFVFAGFNQAQGSTAGLRVDYIASHVVGGLAWQF